MVECESFGYHTPFVLARFQRAKLRKKLVKNNGFWKINAIQPEI